MFWASTRQKLQVRHPLIRPAATFFPKGAKEIAGSVGDTILCPFRRHSPILSTDEEAIAHLNLDRRSPDPGGIEALSRSVESAKPPVSVAESTARARNAFWVFVYREHGVQSILPKSGTTIVPLLGILCSLNARGAPKGKIPLKRER
jgi:hypothetical protein